MDVGVTPDVVEVIGPRGVLEDVDAIQTKPIDISGWSDKAEFPVELDLPRQCRPAVEPWEGEGHVDIKSLTTDRILTGVQVVVRGRSDWVPSEETSSLTLKLSGPTRLLRGLRAEQVFATVEMPADPTEEIYEAAYQAAVAPRLEVVVPWPDQIEVAETPDPVVVVRRP
jgi:hypothetical protein